MQETDNLDSLEVPLFGALDAIGFGQHGNPNHFNTGTLFWSLTRLFCCYERVTSVLHLSRQERPFLDADLEHFIIRFRIVLNDIAYIVWQLLPPNERGLKGPKGPVHAKNREISIFSLGEFLKRHAPTYPELADAISSSATWMARLKQDRDRVVHFKAKVVIFEDSSPSFALLGAAGTEFTEAARTAGQQLPREHVGEFVNGQMLALHRFMHESLEMAVSAHSVRLGLNSRSAGSNHRMTCPGIRRFREINEV